MLHIAGSWRPDGVAFAKSCSTATEEVGAQQHIMASATQAPFIKFHGHHGSNIVLGENSTVAYRKASFANGLVFSESSLKPGEVFQVEITQTELGWNGHLRLGVTQ